MQSATFNVPNAVLLLMDFEAGDIPESIRGSLFASTRTCIAIGCMSDAEGPTKVTLGLNKEINEETVPAYVGNLHVPNKRISVSSVAGDIVLSLETEHPEVRVSIWVNDAREPDQVIIGFEPT